MDVEQTCVGRSVATDCRSPLSLGSLSISCCLYGEHDKASSSHSLNYEGLQDRGKGRKCYEYIYN